MPPIPPVTLTVAICTWNRAALLFQTLERLTRLEPPQAPWELLVVDNGSTDQTQRVLGAFAPRLPLRRLFEPEPGLSHARNAAVRVAAGDYLVWTDDDVLVDPDWLRAYERAVRRWPEAAVFGGPARPRFEGTPPVWLMVTWPEIASAFAFRDLGPEPIELDGKDKIPFGINYAVRLREQRQVLYDPHLGRRHGAGTLDEETKVIRAILAAGGTGRWVPDALVEHWIPKDRQTIRYLRHYYMLLGRTYYRQQFQSPPGTAMLWGRPRWLWRQAVQAEAAFWLALLSGDPHRWQKKLVVASKLWGICRE